MLQKADYDKATSSTTDAGGGYAGAAPVPLASTTEPGTVKQPAPLAALAITVSNPPTQAEVQSVADKLDALIAALKTAGVMAT